MKKLTKNDLLELVKTGLQRELESLRLYRKELERNQKLYAENKRLREALEFYADESNYNRIMLSIITPKVLFDDGEIARKALEVD